MIAVMLQDTTVSFHAAHDKSRLQDAATLRERAKIDLLRDEELAKFPPVRVAIVEIELADGTRLTERVSAVRGTPRNPMSRAGSDRQGPRSHGTSAWARNGGAPDRDGPRDRDACKRPAI